VATTESTAPATLGSSTSVTHEYRLANTSSFSQRSNVTKQPAIKRATFTSHTLSRQTIGEWISAPVTAG
jgi:hypothetical protein